MRYPLILLSRRVVHRKWRLYRGALRECLFLSIYINGSVSAITGYKESCLVMYRVRCHIDYIKDGDCYPERKEEEEAEGRKHINVAILAFIHQLIVVFFSCFILTGGQKIERKK